MSESIAIRLAVSAAHLAFPNWSSTSTEVRSSFLLRIADEIERRFDEFVSAESQDCGKPLSFVLSPPFISQ